MGDPMDVTNNESVADLTMDAEESTKLASPKIIEKDSNIEPEDDTKDQKLEENVQITECAENDNKSPEEIIDRRTKSGKVEYYVKWKGCTDNSWEPEERLDCPVLKATFEERLKKNNSVIELTEDVPVVRKRGRKHKDYKSKKIEEINKPRGVQRGLVPQKIMASQLNNGKLYYLVQWRGCLELDVVPSNQLNIAHPEFVIQYYESCLPLRCSNKYKRVLRSVPKFDAAVSHKLKTKAAPIKDVESVEAEEKKNDEEVVDATIEKQEESQKERVQVEAGQGESGQEESGQGESGQEESGQGESGQEESAQEESGQGEGLQQETVEKLSDVQTDIAVTVN